jgi:SWI/SNF-related matrix-associated actin-dependent regulator 1 of chromatin subfamily A
LPRDRNLSFRLPRARQERLALSSSKGARSQRDVVARVKRVMQPFVLRRTKADVLSELMPKTQRTVRLQMGRAHKECYDSIIARWQTEKAALLAGGLSKRSINNVFTELRKAANHPLLVRARFTTQLLTEEVGPFLHRVGHFGGSASLQQARPPPPQREIARDRERER